MRLFIAVPIESPVSTALTVLQSTFRENGVRGNYTPERNLHLTLAFLGEVRDPRPVISVLEQIPLPESVVSFSKTELFHDILVGSFRIEPSLRQYVQTLREALDMHGIYYDRKPFRPHVTLVRRAVFSEGKPDTSVAEDMLRSLDFTTRCVCLMRTDFIARRPEYTSIFSKRSETKNAQTD